VDLVWFLGGGGYLRILANWGEPEKGKVEEQLKIRDGRWG